MITWNEQFATGDPRTDSQHKVLIDKLNEMEGVLSSQHSGDIRREAGEVLDFLQFYAAWHFEQEEAYMEKIHCPVAQQNKEAHAGFLKKFGAFYSQWQSSSMDLDLARTTYRELSDWVVNHILAVDTQMKPCVGESAEE